MLVKSMLRQIKSSMGRFLAIFAIIALGVGFYSGLRVANQAMMKTADQYLEELNFYDFRLLSTLGLKEKDVEEVGKLDFVIDAEGSISADFLYVQEGGSDGVLHAHMLLDNINQLDLQEGRLPQSANECVLDGKFFSDDMIGKYIRLSQENDSDTLDMFAYQAYRVVGIVDSPCYVNFERGTTSLGTGSPSGYIYVTRDAFDLDYFTEIYVTVESDGSIYSDEYEQDIDAVRTQMEEVIRDRAKDRYDEIYQDAKSEIDDARAELDDGWDEYYKEKSKADKELADAKEELDKARGELDNAWTQAKEEYDKAVSTYGSYANVYDMFVASRNQLNESEIEYQENYAEYLANKAKASKELDEAYQELLDGEEELKDAEQELEDFGTFEDYNTYALDRTSNVGYACLENDTNIVAGIAKVFPLFFFLVAALVCITTMTRMVQEQRTHNGVLKALGYNDRAIIGQYLVYAGSASVAGCIVGFLVGSRYLPWILWKVYHIMYTIERPVAFVLDWKLFAFCTALYMFCALGATWLVCRQELQEVAAELIRPKAPQSGKRILLERIPFIWKRIPFLHKVSIRNILRYKKRMLMMILGIGGCTALLLTGFGIRDSIKNIVDFQYEEISVFDGTVTFMNTPDEDEQEEYTKKNASVLETQTFVFQTSMDFTSEEGTDSVKLVCFQEPMTEFIDLHDTDKNPLQWPKSGEIVVDYRLARDNDIQVGDTITLHDSDYRTITARVSGIFENYIYDYAFMPFEDAADQYEETSINTMYYKITDGQDVHKAQASLLDDDNVLNVSLNQDMRDRVGNMLKSMDYVVLIVLVCAGALAFIVLYNLTNISINERIREIATLKVLGFYPLESAKYVFRENLVLTGISAAFGIPMGIALLQYVMAQIQIKAMYFPCHLMPVSYGYAIVITFAFAFIVAFFLYFKLEKIDMAESMKAIE